MTAREFAEKKDVTYHTVIRWIGQGLIPGAELVEVVPGLKIWQIPVEAADTIKPPKAGRPKIGKLKKPGKGSAKRI